MAKKFMYVCIGIMALAVTFHLGARYSQATVQTPEIAVATDLIYHGQEIPLPYYADTTQALEEECTWMVIPTALQPAHGVTYGFECYAHGNSYRTLTYRQWTVNGTYVDGAARYLVIAVRGSGPTSTRTSTWGKIKAEWGE
jgi:hypothetical protein